MASVDPVWRVRTRPCPFYQRGGCIFEANCNFLHINPAKKDSGYDSDSSFRSLRSPEPMDHPPTPTKGPVVIVDSPRSVTSPTREPHMARLLSALTPLIGEDDEEDSNEQYMDSVTLIDPNDPEAWPSGLPTLVHGADTEFFAQVTETMAEMMRVTEESDDDDRQTILNQFDDDPYDFGDSFFSALASPPMPQDSGSPLGQQQSQLSPDDSPSNDTLRLPSSTNDFFKDTPSIHTTFSSPDPGQEMEMPPIPDNHNDLLSPVDFSQLHLHNFGALDDTIDTWKDTSSIDSGFVDSTNPVQSTSQIFSPQKSPVVATFGVIHSPFGSPSSRVLSPRIGAFIGRSPSSPLRELRLEEHIHRLEDDLDSPSDRQRSLISSSESDLDRIYSQQDAVSPEEIFPFRSPSPNEGEEEEEEDDDDEEDEEEGEGEEEEEDEEQSFEGESLDNIRNSNSSGDESSYEEDTQEFLSFGHTGIWGEGGGDTSVFVGSNSPYLEQVEEELQRQNSQPSIIPEGIDTSITWDDADVSSPKSSPAVTDLASPHAQSATHDFIDDDDVMDREVASPHAQPVADEFSHHDAVALAEERTWDYTRDFSTTNADVTIEAIDYPLDDRSPSPSPIVETRSVEVVTPVMNIDQVLAHTSSGSDPEGSPDYLQNDSPPLFRNDDEDRLGFASNAHQSDQYDDSDDSTALLGYLQPESESQDGDTLYSLYDSYTDEGSPSPPPVAEVLPVTSNPSTPSRYLRERVFTPPPDKVPRYAKPTAQSPPLFSSPPTSLGSPFQERRPPLETLEPVSEPLPSQDDNEPPPSAFRKVQFGFRANRPSSRLSVTSTKNRNVLQVTTNNLDDFEDLSRSATPPSSSGSSGGAGAALRPLRLSVLLHSHSASNSFPRQSSTAPSSITSFAVDSFSRSDFYDPALASSAPLQNTVSNNSLSTPRSAPYHTTTNGTLAAIRSPSLLTEDFNYLATFGSPISAPISAPTNWPSHHLHQRSQSRLSEPIHELDQDDEEDDDTNHRHDVRDETIRRPIGPPPPPRTAPVTRAVSRLRQSMNAIATPKPTLMFAIASDDVEQVRQVLESGDANPNDSVGPQSALAFALSNDQLLNKLDIVKTLLAFGADPSVLKDEQASEEPAGEGQSDEVAPQNTMKALMEGMDPATRYYVERAKNPQTRRTSALIHRSFFRPLARVQYDLIGQDRALEELFKLLSIHSRQIAVSPLVVMFSGPSGHGKSLLARKFGSLLDVPTHTVNMVTLRSQDDLWESYSISPIEEPTNCTLAEFLANNEGKRCVVVLDEIEKVANEKVLWSLLMPWEHGRCSFEARSRHIDVRNVIWLCTSNIGQDLVYDHWNAREYTEEVLTRREFLDLVALLRPLVSERLGASVLSRITSVLPFVPFTQYEKRAMSAEAIFQLGGEDALALAPPDIETLIQAALDHYIPEEGARSLHRAISNHLVDMI